MHYLIMSRFFSFSNETYINVFKDNGVFSDLPIAYYSGSRAIYEMYKSEDERDKEIMDELCELIVERHKK